MVTTASKFFYGFAVALLVTAVVHGYTTGGNHVGPLTAGYKGGVGDLVGYTILLFAATAVAVVGFLVTATRDADPEAVAELLGVETPPAPTAPGLSYWPIVGAFGVGLTVVGLVLNNVFFVAGLIAVGIVAIEWTVQTWADRATGDAATNRRIRNRVMLPLEIPVGGALAIAVVVFGLSRAFLAVSSDNAVWFALAGAAIVFGLGSLLSFRPSLRTDLVAGVLVVGAAAVIAAGIIGAVAGERSFEHEGEHSEDEGDGDDAEEGALVVIEEVAR